jgi:hypothetical protein
MDDSIAPVNHQSKIHNPKSKMLRLPAADCPLLLCYPPRGPANWKAELPSHMSDTPGEARATQVEVKTGGGASRAATAGKWAVVLACAFAIALVPVPEGVTPQSWRLLAIFAATIVGSIVRPVPGAAVVLLGVTATALLGVLPVEGMIIASSTSVRISA